MKMKWNTEQAENAERRKNCFPKEKVGKAGSTKSVLDKIMTTHE